jgi:hypothetical protein
MLLACRLANGRSLNTSGRKPVLRFAQDGLGRDDALRKIEEYSGSIVFDFQTDASLINAISTNPVVSPQDRYLFSATFRYDSVFVKVRRESDPGNVPARDGDFAKQNRRSAWQGPIETSF